MKCAQGRGVRFVQLGSRTVLPVATEHLNKAWSMRVQFWNILVSQNKKVRKSFYLTGLFLKE